MPFDPAVYYAKIHFQSSRLNSRQAALSSKISRMELTVIILNWNAASDTVRCVQNASSWRHLQPKILVVDNASTDGSLATISRECPEADLIRNSINLGFGGGNNKGITAALSMGDAPILLLNSDAWIKEKDVIRLLETLQAEDQIGFVGPLLFDAEQRDKLLAAGSRDPALHHHSHNRRLPTGDSVRIVECVPGTVFLARAELFHEAGLLDERYFYGSEVADLCLRAKRYGYLGAVDIRARAYHDLSRSSDFRRALYPYYIIRNRFLLIRKFHRRWKILLYIFWTIYSLALSAKEQLRGESSTARGILLGLLDGLRGRFGNQNERVLNRISK